MRHNALMLAAAMLLGGCASGYSQFYQPVNGVTPEMIAAQRVAPPPAIPILDRSGDKPEAVAAAYNRHGYGVIGFSSFNGAAGQSEEGALEQGAKVGADVVVVISPQYTGTRSTVIPFTTPTAQTSYTSGTATAYGSGGPVFVSGNSTTTTYGSRTTYIPMHTDRYDYGALYFVKRKYVLGANWRDLSDEERQAIQSNRGLYIMSVVNGSPAFNSDILAGDILLEVQGEAVTSQDAAGQQLAALAGQKIEVTLYRQGQRIRKVVQLAK